MAHSDHHHYPLSVTAAVLSSSSSSYHHLHFQRGPNYAAYSRLRESRLRKRHQEQDQSYATPSITPTSKKKEEARSPMVARSVPDFASALRKEKENRKPPPASRLDVSTGSASPLPPKKPARFSEAASMLKTPSPVGARRVGVGGSVRKSYSCLKELKGFCDVGESSRFGKVLGAAAAGVRRYG